MIKRLENDLLSDEEVNKSSKINSGTVYINCLILSVKFPCKYYLEFYNTFYKHGNEKVRELWQHSLKQYFLEL